MGVAGYGGVAIRAEGIGKRFGRAEALRDVDLVVARGTVVGLLGPNGAGKTTMVRILTTLLRPDSGRAVVDGLDVVREAQEVRYRLGLAGQQAAVDEFLTGAENLEMVGRLYHMGGRAARRRAGELLERFALTDAAHRMAKTYSGGMRRRLDLAASLVAEPPVLFLDEPTTGLDPRSRIGMWDVIRELVRGGTTLLLTTQYLEEADRLADEIVVMDAGAIVARGTADALKRRVGGERIDVQVREVGDLAVARAVMAAAVGSEPDVDAGARRLMVPVAEGPAALAGVVRELDVAGIALEDIALRRPTLDEVFLRLTGHAAEEGPRDRAAPRGGSGGLAEPAGVEVGGAGPGRAVGVGGAAGPGRAVGVGGAVCAADAADAPDPAPEPAAGRETASMDATLAGRPGPTAAARLLWLLGDAWTVARRNLTHIRRVPEKLTDVTIQPIMFVFMFAYIFGSAILVPGGNYRAFLMPGIFAQSMAFASMSIMAAIVNDMSKGVMDRFRSLPMARASVLIGHAVSTLVEGVLGLVVMVGCGFVVGWRIETGPGAALGAFGLLLLFAFALMCVATFAAMFVRSVEAVQAVGFVIIFPFTFVANTFVPTQGMPPWLRVVAQWNPMSAVVAACRQLFGNAAAAGAAPTAWPLQHPVLMALVFGIAISAVFLPLAVARFRTVTSQ